MLDVKKSRKSNKPIPKSSMPTPLIDSEQREQNTNIGNSTIKHAFLRLIFKEVQIKAIGTSATETVDVNAATTNNAKNNIAHSWGIGSCVKICGRVIHTRVVPSVPPSMPNDLIAGKIIKPISTAIKNTNDDTVNDVFASFTRDG